MSSNSPQGRAAKLAIECDGLRRRATVAEKALAYANGFIANMNQIHANQANYCAELTAKLAVAEDALARLTPLMAEVERRYLENFSCPKASDLGVAIQALLDALAPAPDRSLHGLKG